MDNQTACVDLDRLQAIADRLDERGSFATSAELREMIYLARRAEPSVAAVDERALRLIHELSRISMSLAADLLKGAVCTFQEHDYLDRNAVVARIMQWRAEWDATAPERTALVEQARAALASPAVSQKAAPEPVVRLHIRSTEDYLKADIEVLDGTHLQPEDSPVDLYLAPNAVSQMDGAAVAWLATDLDGNGDVAFTKDEARCRAGEICTEFVALVPAATTASASSDTQADFEAWARSHGCASRNSASKRGTLC